MSSLFRRAAVAAVVVAFVAAIVVAAATTRHDERGRESSSDTAPAVDEGTTTAASSGGVAPFDPAKPIELGGVRGVTDAQQRAAEDLVRSVLDARDRLPSYEEALRQGYVSIGDAFTGDEHLLDWSAVLDPAMLDPAHPEGLVFDVADDGERTLVAVMFVLPPATRVDEAPAPGGSLTRWHLHGELCLDPRRDPPAVTAATDATGTCPVGLVEQQPSPTLHVWVVAHPCGPFSELEGVGTDSVEGGCDHHHG